MAIRNLGLCAALFLSLNVTAADVKSAVVEKSKPAAKAEANKQDVARKITNVNGEISCTKGAADFVASFKKDPSNPKKPSAFPNYDDATASAIMGETCFDRYELSVLDRLQGKVTSPDSPEANEYANLVQLALVAGPYEQEDDTLYRDVARIAHSSDVAGRIYAQELNNAPADAPCWKQVLDAQVKVEKCRAAKGDQSPVCTKLMNKFEQAGTVSLVHCLKLD